ncbi:hypothetical protein [Nonomuraea dietziae]|uniref:hypothetical protein n=1 Tax=Nonomuraea dietziae TaxID=65515 RepID=UPI0031CF928F
MFWSQPNPCASTTTGPSERPVTVTLFLRQMSMTTQFSIFAEPTRTAGRHGARRRLRGIVQREGDLTETIAKYADGTAGRARHPAIECRARSRHGEMNTCGYVANASPSR